MEKRENFGRYIKEKRKEAGLSQKELAKQLFVSESAVSKWERGLSYPDMTLVTSLCEILHVSEHELLTASDDMHQREIEEQSRGYLRILKGYTWITYICYLAVLIPCFIGNLVTEHRLSWFFIVVGGLAMIFSFINVPVMTKTRRKMLLVLLWITHLHAVCLPDRVRRRLADYVSVRYQLWLA